MNWKWISKYIAFTAVSTVLFFFTLVLPGFSAESDTVTVFAAASTTNAISEIGELFTEKKLGAFLPSFAASSTLAKQIENGAPASVYLSANEKWMDYLEEINMIHAASRFDLLGNRIVLIAPADSPIVAVDIVPHFGLKALLGGGYLAMGDPDHVPAGIYAKQALENLGVWNDINADIARQKDVRSALTLVERGEVPLGVVYATDVAITDKVKVVGVFPENSHPRIVYPVALVKGNKTPAAEGFLDFLRSGEARNVFKKYGFTIME
jgi:molybdate transport system substrate-binding protein